VVNSGKLERQEALSPAIGYNGRAGEKTVLAVNFYWGDLNQFVGAGFKFIPFYAFVMSRTQAQPHGR